jgi:hypothetical protein
MPAIKGNLQDKRDICNVFQRYLKPFRLFKFLNKTDQDRTA